MSQPETTKRLAPRKARDAASARRWLDRIMRTLDMDYTSKTNLQIAVSTLRALEQREIADHA